MDVGPALKAAVPSNVTVPSASSAAGPLTTGTQLSAPQVVVASGQSGNLNQDAPKPAPRRSLDDVTERRVMIDEDTREIVMQSIDSRTNSVVSQSPDKAILGLRAYFDRLVENTTAKAGASRTDASTTKCRLSLVEPGQAFPVAGSNDRHYAQNGCLSRHCDRRVPERPGALTPGTCKWEMSAYESSGECLCAHGNDGPVRPRNGILRSSERSGPASGHYG
jgi:hypothetical protein